MFQNALFSFLTQELFGGEFLTIAKISIEGFFSLSEKHW